MARTPLFGALKRAFAETGVPIRPRALSRRSFLAMSAALAACGTQSSAASSIAIVGGGTAGLVCAYRLMNAQRAVTLYEASDRLGGRMFTRQNFNEDGQFCELGGELVDTGHTALKNLAGELNVAIDKLAPPGEEGEDYYIVDGRLHAQHELVDAQGHGVFNDLARRIGEDQAQLLQGDEWTPHSLAAYFYALGNRAPRWVMDLIEVAYWGEFGIPVAEQSALNFVDFIGTDAAKGFQMFGESDELFRIHGGSQALPDAIATRLTRITIERQHALNAVARTNNGVKLTFNGPSGPVEKEHERVVFALPFTRLRQVSGIDAMGLSAAKLRAIRELGYGDNAKLMISTTGRPWNSAPQRFRAKASGVFISDTAQSVWDTSRGQEGDRGILTNYLAGSHDRDAALQRMSHATRAFLPAMPQSFDPSKTAWMDWSRQPNHLGSFAGAKVGQYTTLLEEAGTPSEDGRIHFAGEHTSADFLGYMNGAVESGERAARELLG